MSPARDFDLFQLTNADQDTITRALEAYQRALAHEAELIERSGDGGPIGDDWAAAEMDRIRRLLGAFAGAGP